LKGADERKLTERIACTGIIAWHPAVWDQVGAELLDVVKLLLSRHKRPTAAQLLATPYLQKIIQGESSCCCVVC
jgi:hypothetical protein